MNFDELLVKMANNARLTPRELDFLRRHGRETQNRNAFVAGNTTASNQLNIKFPFAPIFSEVLGKDTASLLINIPSGYRHLMIFGMGRITSATGGNVWCQFNHDTGSNYEWSTVHGDGSSAASAQDTSDPYAALGLFSNSGDAAGSASSFEAKIANYGAAYEKMVLAETYYNDGTTRTIYLIGSKWKDTSQIESIEIFATDNTLAKGSTNIAAGAVISVYGLL